MAPESAVRLYSCLTEDCCFLRIVGQKVGETPLTRADSLSGARYLALYSRQVVKAGTKECEYRRCLEQEAASTACDVNQVTLKKEGL